MFLPHWEWIEKTKRLILNFSEMVWDIITKFSPVVKLYRNPLCTKYEGFWCTKFGFPAKTVKNIKWAWQVQFLSYTLQIWWKFISFEYLQMKVKSYFAKSTGIKFGKICLSPPSWCRGVHAQAHENWAIEILNLPPFSHKALILIKPHF